MDSTNGTESGREITVNQAVAWNLARVHRDAGLTQQQLGERIGWTSASVSEAERSWDGKRVREFSAHDLAVIALALAVPVAALLLPPDEEERLWFADGEGEARDIGALMRLAMPDNAGQAPAMRAYRLRWDRHLRHYYAGDTAFTDLAGQWVGEPADRAMLAARLRRDRERLLGAVRGAAATLDVVAARLDPQEAE